MKRLGLALVFALLAGGCDRTTPMITPSPSPVAAANPDQPRELGWVRWQRQYDVAAAEAKRSGKPLFVLFQEVPGCATCVGFGESVLSHPLLIETIETEFVPVAIHNNKAGHDRDVLKRFGEPSWNNPVVRFVDADGRDLLPRADGVWSTHGIATRMVTALEKANRPVPEHLRWAVAESAPRGDATFAMGCYWTGEACLGGIDGVVGTHAGWLDGREVVEVQFDRARTDAAQVRREAERRGCGAFVARPSPARSASDTDRKYHLKRSRLRLLPLTPFQESRVNSALGRGGDPNRWLTPRQRELRRRLEAADAGALRGLERPEATGALASYEHTLRQRLVAR